VLCLLSPSSHPSQQAQERRRGLTGCKVLCWARFGCFPGKGSEAGECGGLSTPRTTLFTITSQHPRYLLVSLCIGAGCSCIIAGGQESCSRGDASPPNPWRGQSGERTPSSGLLALLAQPAPRAERLGSSQHGRGCVQPQWLPFIFHSCDVSEVTNTLPLTAMEPSSSWGFAEKKSGRCGQAAVERRTRGWSWWDSA